MKPIKWNEKFELGFKKIDDQHKNLVGILNEVIEARNENKQAEIISGTLDKLVKYTQYHFSAEEKFMEEHNYPRIAEHKLLHKELVQEVEKINRDFDADNVEKVDEVFDLLIHWVLNHILEKDMDYKKFINNN